MKIKNALFTLGLTLTLGIGIGAGLAARQDVKETKADGSTRATRIYVDATASHWFTGWKNDYSHIGAKVWINGVGSDQKIDNVTPITIDAKQYGYFDLPSSSYDIGYIFNWNDGSAQNKTSTNFTIPSDGKNLLVLTGGSDSAGPTWAWSDDIIEVSTTFDVHFDENGDGTPEKTLPVVSGDTVASYTPYKFGKTFVAWKLGNAVYDFSTPVTAEITLTASWTDRAGEVGYFYVITGYGADWATRYVYGYGAADGYGAWKGQLVKDIAVGCTSTTNFGGGSNEYKNGGIYKVPYYTEDAMTNIVLHNNGSDDDRSGDLPFGANYGYFFKDNPWDSTNKKFDEAGIASVGKAAAYVYHFDELLSGKDFCKELDAGECATLYNAYLAAIDGDNTAKGWIDSSVINTSNGGDNVRLDTILAELRKIAVRDGQKVNDSNRVNIISSENVMYIVIVAFAAISAVGVFFAIKRRKHISK